MNRPEPRYRVNLPVYLTWQQKDGTVRRSAGKCTNLSASGALVETDYPLDPQTTLIVHCDKFGRVGHAVVRYCRRHTMKYQVGLLFTASLGLGDSVRRRMFEKAIQEV